MQGIEFDSDGNRVAYWLYPNHPGSGVQKLSGGWQSKRIPAENVLHIYDVERPGQARGVPWMCAVIAKIQDFDEYDDAKLLQQKIAACFGAFITDEGFNSVQLGGDAGKNDDGDQLEELEPGQINKLAPGQKISTVTPPALSDHGGFSATSLRKIGVGMGLTYEELTGDFSQVNFSSARMSRMVFADYVADWRWHMLIPVLCDGVWRWVMEMAFFDLDEAKRPSAEWSPPPQQMLEPEKEGLAWLRLIRSGARTPSQMIRELGENPAAHFGEYADDLALLDKLGVVLDCDSRLRTSSGQAQATGTVDTPVDGEEDGSDAET
jgi:lambda family phage portal protein